MKNNFARLTLVLIDVLAIYIAVSLAYALRIYLNDQMSNSMVQEIKVYNENILVYVIIIATFINEKIYKYRYDFWEETRLILRGLFISFIIILSVLALTKSGEDYSRFIIVFSYAFMSIFTPMMKNMTKKILFRLGAWKKEAEVCGNDTYIKKEIFGNHYLGYVYATHQEAQTVFIDTNDFDADELQKHLDISLREKKEVLFIPLLQSYNLANARIIELSNARKNLIVVENSLLKISNIWTKKLSDIVLSILVFPLFVILFLIIVLLIKKEEPKGSIFFRQKRMGYNGKEFVCYKFRSMYKNAEPKLKTYLEKNPDEIINYDKYHKYKNDPRITKIGRILRKTSLDELPQIINVLKGEMSLIGPRPYMRKEKDKIGEKLDMVLAVKPGITGLWQVSGRSEVDFNSRVDMDVWYTRNWNLWLDLVILVKTIKVVLFRDGAH